MLYYRHLLWLDCNNVGLMRKGFNKVMKKILIMVLVLMVPLCASGQVKSTISTRCMIDSDQSSYISLPGASSVVWGADLATNESAETYARMMADEYGGVYYGSIDPGVCGVSGSASDCPYAFHVVLYDDSKSKTAELYSYPVKVCPNGQWPEIGATPDAWTVPLDTSEYWFVMGLLGIVCGGLLVYAILHNV